MYKIKQTIRRRGSLIRTEIIASFDRKDTAKEYLRQHKEDYTRHFRILVSNDKYFQAQKDATMVEMQIIHTPKQPMSELMQRIRAIKNIDCLNDMTDYVLKHGNTEEINAHSIKAKELGAIYDGYVGKYLLNQKPIRL